jgi:hypothetical protein
VTASQGGTLLTLAHDQLIPGVSVSGTLRLSEASTPADGQTVLGTLTARAPGLKQDSFTAIWTTTGPEPARVLGTISAEAISGEVPAP